MQINDVSEYVTWNIPRPVFYIQNLLTLEGSMLIYGAPGVMKSWLAEYTAFCIATGSEWLNFPVTQARTLIVNFEISSDEYHWRLRDMSHIFAVPEQMMYVASPSLTYLEERGTFERFAADIRPIQPKVIILDCMSACFGGDENSSREMSGFIQNITELKNEHHAAVILIHHSNKNILAMSPMDRARGHTKLTGWVDSIIYMINQPSGKQLQFGKTRNSRTVLHNLNIQFQDYNWTVRRQPDRGG